MNRQYISAPHWEVNEEGRRFYHSGYFEKECTSCSDKFLVANHLVEVISVCAKCSVNRRDEKDDEENKSTST